VCTADRTGNNGAISPFDFVDQQMRMMQQDMARMERAMDRDFDSLFGRARQMEEARSANAQDARQWIENWRARQGISRMERANQQGWVDRGNGMRTYHREHNWSSGGARSYTSESIIIWGGAPTAPPPAVGGPGIGLWVSCFAAVLVGTYAAVSAAFARNFDLTTFHKRHRWQLVLLWPFLALFSPAFKAQFLHAIAGRKVRVQAAGGEAGADVRVE
jgi:hypothetical protein